MLKYRIEIEGKNNPLPVVHFEDERYELAATFLLGEARNFGKEILAALGEVMSGKKKTAAFAGNVFSLEITSETTSICDDISGKECEMDTKELERIAEEYWAAYREMRDQKE